MSTDQTYDAASIVGQAAGLERTDPQAPITAAQLVKRFCSGADAEYLGRPASSRRRDDDARADIAEGFCGYVGGHGDNLITGYDDGYTFMGHLSAHGWRPLADLGDWPYVVYLFRNGQNDERPTLARYLEADLTVWEFDDLQAAKAFIAQVADSE